MLAFTLLQYYHLCSWPEIFKSNYRFITRRYYKWEGSVLIQDMPLLWKEPCTTLSLFQIFNFKSKFDREM